MKEFSGRIAVVTGGGSGMGRELVRLLVAEGCHVAICGRTAETLERAAEDVRARGEQHRVNVHVVVADVTAPGEVERFVEEHGHPPQHGEGRDIFERLYAVRLDRLRTLADCRAVLQPLDHQGLLACAEPAAVTAPDAPSALCTAPDEREKATYVRLLARSAAK